MDGDLERCMDTGTCFPMTGTCFIGDVCAQAALTHMAKAPKMNLTCIALVDLLLRDPLLQHLYWAVVRARVPVLITIGRCWVFGSWHGRAAWRGQKVLQAAGPPRSRSPVARPHRRHHPCGISTTAAWWLTAIMRRRLLASE